MSFNEFIQWLQGLFSRRNNQATPPPVTPVEPARPNEAQDTPPISPPSAPVVDEPATPEPPVTIAPVINAIKTDTDKVALKTEVVFQIVTTPPEQYTDCELNLSQANNISIIKPLDPATGTFTLRFDKASNSDNDVQLIQVSNPQGSMSHAITVSLMKLLWKNHAGRKNICDETRFVNQCAIRMGAALELSGIKLSEDRRVLRRCTTEYRVYRDHKSGLIKGHVLAAQELANWIKSQPSTFGPRHIFHSKEEIMGKSGLIFFRDGWGTTDHIDIWDGAALVGGFPSYFDSDFKELWFWDMY